ncbi:hypothetical protein GCM10023171_09550 [Microbacterium panaciterrae]|uniref:Uncharacterized protein n=1 Tax=Microbacterium panaciterrae TaxID=985759 RepID=A0ABP8P6P9_9MICO
MNGSDFEAPDNQDFDRLEAEFFTELKASSRRRTRRHRWVAGATALAITLGAGTAWIVLANQHLRERATYCYAKADVNARYATVAATDETTSAAGQAVDRCAGLWQIGYFDSASPASDDGRAHAVPTLEACVRPDGVYAVFPNTEGDTSKFCERLGLTAAG